MSWRWIRRMMWAALLLAMVIIPARVAQSPEPAQAGEPGATETPRQGISSATVVTWVVLGSTLAAVPVVMRLRRRLSQG